MDQSLPAGIVAGPDLLPPRFAAWFATRNWQPHPHQLAMLAAARAGKSALLIAPTGGGKTLAGFLPSLVELAEQPTEWLHTLYISPLKALAVDIQRNLEQPIAEMDLAIRAETRTGDTPNAKRQRQRSKPPQLLMTTPESLALLLSLPDAPILFGGLRRIVIDELHALAGTKRGDLLALGLARLGTLAPGLQRVGLSATVAWPDALDAYLAASGRADGSVARIAGADGSKPEISILDSGDRLPWAGHMAAHATPEIFAAIKAHRTSIVFVNTRAQAEIIFQALWRLNDETLPIALHHGSLAVEQRRKVEAAMARGSLRAVVATSSLDLGIDWAAVDLVIQVGAPKGASRLLQRIGRANHRLDRPSRALLVPGNRFEAIECVAARQAALAGELDGDRPRDGALDVLAQHVLGMACSTPIAPDILYREVTSAAPYADLTRSDFDDIVAFVATGGYALGAYERFRRLTPAGDGTLSISSPDIIRRYRMNIGTIVQSVMLRIRLRGGRMLGEVEEYFVQGLLPGDSFVFAGELLRFERLRDMIVEVTRGNGDEPKVPTYQGGRLPLTTHLASRVRRLLADPKGWDEFPRAVKEWLGLQRWRSLLPRADGMLAESFPRDGREYLVCYPFEGRAAHQTLGMLLTKRMERAGLGPLGFVATDYVLGVWSVKRVSALESLFAEDMLGDDFEEWMAESAMLKRTFRNIAVIAGLIERRSPGSEKSSRQVTFNSDLIYDVLRRHEPNHILLRATRADAAGGLTDVARLSALLARIKGRISLRRLDRISPLSLPVLLEIGRESVSGSGIDMLLDEAADALIAEAMQPASDTPQLPL